MNNKNQLTCFKAYDVRGKLGEEFNEEIAYRIGRATALSLGAKVMALGFDARETSPMLAKAVARGICDAGSDVLELGLVGTEEIYSAVSAFDADAGIEVTASHNPIDYNGLKIVKSNSQPLSEQEFNEIKQVTKKSIFSSAQSIGSIINKSKSARESYLKKIIDFIDLKTLKPFKIVINSGNGAAGPTVDAFIGKLEEYNIKTNFVLVNHNPDATFPNGIPNPLLKENRCTTSEAVLREKADFGVAFDGDFDRCFIFDQFGNFIPGEYIVGLLAEIFLRKEKGATIVHDPRLVWNTMDVIQKYGGHSVVSKTGHAFVKAIMRDSNAVYGGEVSAHHYFRDFFYCDSGMIPWILIWEYLSKKNISVADLIAKRQKKFISSDEINFKVSDAAQCILSIKRLNKSRALYFDELDGLSMYFGGWRFNLRKSNTEPLVRLNVETKGDHLLLKSRTKELTDLISEM